MSMLALFSGASPGWGSPDDVLRTDVPVLGGEPPKSRDLQEGDASVSTQTGAFQYSYPLTLPPGRLVQPSLSLAYSSSAAIHGSPVGAGWALSIPEIRRDPAQSWLASQSSDFVPRFVSSMAGGNRLVPVTEPAACDVFQTYRAQFDGTYARYERLQTSCSVPLPTGVWRVRTTDGLTHYFGEPAFMGNSNDLTWAPLTRTVDPFGNTVTYVYFPVEDLLDEVVEYVLDHIDYTSNPSASLQAHATVQFSYTKPASCSPLSMAELPVGARLEARSGQVKWVGSHRLDSIRTRVRNGSGWRDVRTVALSYDSAAAQCGQDHGPIRLLTSIQESATSPNGVTTSIPPVTFTYGQLRPSSRVPQSFGRGIGPDTFDDSLSAGYRAGGPGTAEWPQLEVMMLDLDGDGRQDRVFADPDSSGCAFRWQRNEGDGFGVQSAKIRLPTFHWGDGSGTDPDGECSLAGQRSMYFNRSLDPAGCPGNRGHYLSYRFLDLNGDGLPELVTGLQVYGPYLDPSPLCDGPQDPDCNPPAIPTEWGWDPDYVCPEPLAGQPAGLEPPGTPDPGGCPVPRVHLSQCGEYLWLVYWNRGDGTFDEDPSPRFNPLPLESNAFDTGLGSRRLGFSSSIHAIIDIDGDGFLDAVTRVAADFNDGFVVFRGNGTGNFSPKANGEPYLFRAPTHATTGRTAQAWVPDTPLSSNGTAHVYSYAGLMDASGDGLPDLLFAPNLLGAPVASYVNLGDRFRFSDEVDGPGNPVWPFEYLTHSVTDAVSFDQGNTINNGTRAGSVFPLDYDADGRLDLYWRVDLDGDGDDDGDQGRLFTGDGAGDVTESLALSAVDRDGIRQYLEADTEFRVLRDYVDLDGDGALDYVEQGTGTFVYQADAEVLAGKPPRLLHGIDNGAGGTTDVRYRASTDTAIDIPGTDDTEGMPTHTWLVDTVTRTDVADTLATTGTLTGTTTYRYGRPVYNRALHPSQPHGQYAFRGFERVRETSPLGAVTESVYDYSLDWSGRLVEITEYEGTADLAAGTPDSIEQTTWQPLTLFCPSNAQAQADEIRYYECGEFSFVVPVLSFQPVDQKTWTCSNGQPRADCLTTGARRVDTTTWLGKVAEGDNPDTGLQLLHFERSVWRKKGDAIQDRDRRSFYAKVLFSGASFYRLRLTSEHAYERVDGVDQQRSQRVHFWGLDASGNDGAFETATRDHLANGDTATNQKRNDLGLGLVTRRRKPEQYQQNQELWTYLAYDPTLPVQPVSTTNELGHVVLTDHDLGTGALLRERGPNSVPDGSGGTEHEGTSTVIDGFGRPLEIYAMTEDPANGTYREVLIQRFTYRDDLIPRRVIEERRIDWNGPDFTKVQTEYDGFGRVQERKEFRFEAGTIDPIERFRYDSQGNVDRVQVRDPSLDTGASVAYLYDFDALDRPTRVERPNGSCIAWAYDGLTTTRREVATNCPTGGMTADPEAETTTTKDVFGRLEQVDERIGSTTVATTLYAWDANDNLRRVESPDGIITVLDHDWMSRRTAITRGERRWVYTYDLNGNLEAERSPVPGDDPLLYDDYTTTTGYDALDRPTSRVIGPREIAPAILEDLGVSTISFAYDQGTNGLGRLTGVSNPIWTRTYEHDARGNVVEDSLHFDLDALGVSIEDTRTRVRTFNPLGGVVDEWHGDGTTVSGSTHTTTAYNRRGLPATLTWQQMTPVVLANATRNGAGLLKSLGAGPVTQTWAHDNLGRVTSMSAASTAGGLPAISETWTYYATDDPHTLATSRTGVPTRNFTFSFDDRHQLENAFDNAGYSADFTFTTGGRLLTADVASMAAPLAPPRNVGYVYPQPQDPDYDLHDPEAVKALAPTSGGFSMAYGFDLAGNVTSRTEGGGTPDFTFLYDGEDQQRIATSQGGDHELYYYDHDGQRLLAVSRQPGGTITKVRLWLGPLEVEYGGGGAVTQTLAHLSLEQPVARIENRDTAKRVVHGQLGHFLGAFTANNSALDVAFVYGPFGEILAQSGPDPADYTQRFNGKEQDALTSLSYYGARYFDPLSLTWTQADPMYRFAPDAAWDQPRRANLYSFTLNNPVAMVDPDGLYPRPPGGRMGPSGDNTGETAKRGAVLLVHKTASVVASIPVVPPKVRLVAAIIAAATSESGPQVDLENVDPASLPGPPGGPGPPAGKPPRAGGPTGGGAGGPKGQRAGHNDVAGPAQEVVRTTRGGETAVQIRYPDGSIKDVSPSRVKEFVPNNHPNAPPGQRKKVKFENAQPGSKKYKRDPTAEEKKIVEHKKQ